jgi:hypothetical protein
MGAPRTLTTQRLGVKSRCEAALFDEEPIQGLAFGSEPPILRRKRTCSLRLMISRLRAALPLPPCRGIARRYAICRYAVRSPSGVAPPWRLSWPRIETAALGGTVDIGR